MLEKQDENQGKWLNPGQSVTSLGLIVARSIRKMMKNFLFPCRWMQGHHPVLQRGEETEAVLRGYVQTEMLWVVFTGRWLPLVAVSGHNRWATLDWKDIICEWMLRGVHNRTSFSQILSLPERKLNGASEGWRDGRGGFIFWFGPNLLTWSVHYVDQMEFLDFSAKVEHSVFSDIRKRRPAKNEYDVVYL